MNAFRFGTLIRRTCSQISSHQFLRYAGIPKPRFFSDCTDGESAVYHHARLFRKPLSAQFKFKQSNSISLMGFVDRPVRVLDTKPDHFGVFTFLRVKDPRNPNRSFRMSLCMWDGIARTCIAHLKPNDFILVSGRLESYNKSSGNEDRCADLHYNVKVTEVNYVVAPPSYVLESPISGKSTSEADGIEDSKDDDKIYLWQVFFANPYDWWDNRKNKTNPRQPDFKHKDTREALWLNSDKPDWVTRQLELLDQRTAEKSCYDDKRTRSSHLSDWI